MLIRIACIVTNQHLFMMAKKMEANYPYVIGNVSLPSLNLDENMHFPPLKSDDCMYSQSISNPSPNSIAEVDLDELETYLNHPDNLLSEKSIKPAHQKKHLWKKHMYLILITLIHKHQSSQHIEEGI